MPSETTARGVQSSRAEPAPLAWAVPLCRVVADEAELGLHLAIRHRVFVAEQAIFAASDRDRHDSDPTTLHVLAWTDSSAVGAVRLYPLDTPRRWKGDRLAVLPGQRGHRCAEALVRFAVRSAAERGGQLMEAQVQVANVKFFSYLGWRSIGAPQPFFDRPHQAMVIDL